MARVISTELGELLAKRSVNTQTTLDITPVAGESVHIATDGFTLPKAEYLNELVQVEQIQQSIAQSTNRVIARIQNVDKVFGGSIFDEEWVGATALVGRYFRDERTVRSAPDEGEWEPLFEGLVHPLEINESEAVIEIVHDLTAAGFVIANTNLAENCQWVFKQADTCGYSSSETTCNHMRRSKGGCAGRSNEFRYGGMEYPDPQTPLPPQGPVVPPGPGGPEPTFPSCPREDQLILVRGEDDFSRLARPARFVKIGDRIWDPVNAVWNRVLQAEKVHGQAIWEITAANGAKTCVSGTHPIIRSMTDPDGLGVKWMKPASGVLTWSNGLQVETTAKAIRRLGQRGTVVRIETDGNHIFCSGERPDAMIAGHNNVKPIEGPVS